MVEPDPLGKTGEPCRFAVSIWVFAGLGLTLEITKQTSPLKQTCQIILLRLCEQYGVFYVNLCN